MNRTRIVRVEGNTNPPRVPSNIEETRNDNISTCSSLCTKALECILSAKSPNSAVNYEIRLWQQVRIFKEEPVIRFLNGFYSMLSDLLRLAPQDPYFTHPNSYKSNSQTNLLLIYNVTVRLGDISRYLHRHLQTIGSEEASLSMKLASSYYYKAHSLLPSRSHALHQLALIATPDPIVQIYWYIRAIHAKEEPLSIASFNLSHVVKKHTSNNQLIAFMFQKDLNDSFSRELNCKIDNMSIENWLITAVLAIHCDRVGNILPLVLNEAISVLSAIASDISSQLTFHPNGKKKLFQGLEVLLSYINSKISSLDPSKLEGKLKTLLQRTAHHIVFILSQSDTFAITGNRCPALSHDKELQGFSPLSSIHAKLDFKCEPDPPGYELILLLKRIRDQCHSLVGVISDFNFSQQKVAVTSIAVNEVAKRGVAAAAIDSATATIITPTASASVVAGAVTISCAKRSQVSETKNTCKEQFTQPSASLPVTPGTTRVPAKVRSRNVALKSILSSE